MKNKYKKHIILREQGFKTVKDFMRRCRNLFNHIDGVPTTFQIAEVLVEQGYSVEYTPTHVYYRP